MSTSYVVPVCNAGGQLQAEIAMGQVRYTCPSNQASFQTITVTDPATEQDVQAQLALLGVDAESITAVFLFGFGTYLLFWFLGFVVELAQKAIRMA